MLTFHATLHRRLPNLAPENRANDAAPGNGVAGNGAAGTLAPGNMAAADTVMLAGKLYATVRWSAEAASASFDCTFEAAAQALEALDGMFCEPDGSFVWSSRPGEPRWQVDGVLYDRHGRLLFVDLKGTCPPARFDELLGAVGWPLAAVVLQINEAAVYLEEAEFRRYATSGAI